MAQAEKTQFKPFIAYEPMLNLDLIRQAPLKTEPYPHIIVPSVLLPQHYHALRTDFPDINRPGFYPLSMIERKGAFDLLLRNMEGLALADVLTKKFGLDLCDKPRLITVRKWSAKKDGRIHNDGRAKICTALLYLNPLWNPKDGGCLRVLRGSRDFEDMVAEVPPLYGMFFAFLRTENSWHGHKPYVGERRVIQTTWLGSLEDVYRKEKRAKWSYFLKKWLPG